MNGIEGWWWSVGKMQESSRGYGDWRGGGIFLVYVVKSRRNMTKQLMKLLEILC